MRWLTLLWMRRMSEREMKLGAGQAHKWVCDATANDTIHDKRKDDRRCWSFEGFWDSRRTTIL